MKSIIFLIGIFLISFVSAGNLSIFVRPPGESSTNIEYQFNLTTNSDGSGVILSHNKIIAIDSKGIGFTTFEIPENISVPRFLVEVKDGVVRKIHPMSSQIFDHIFANNLTLSGNANVTGNITGSTGFFSWLGSLANRITKLFVEDIDFIGNINGSGNINTTGNLNIWGNSNFNGTLMPMTSLAFDIGSGPLRWRNLYVTNISADYGDFSESIIALGNITASGFVLGDGRFLSNVNITDIWVNSSGDTMTGDLNLSLNDITGVGRMTLKETGSIWFGDVNARIYSGATSDIFLDATTVQMWTSDKVSMRVDGDVNDFLYFGTDSDLPYINSYGSNLELRPDSGTVFVTGNVTASWFKGLFNWTSADNWNIFDGSTLDFNESKLSTIYYNLTQSSVIAGTLDGGTLSDTHHSDGKYDGVTMNFSEEAGAPALDIRLNWTGIESFNRGIMRYKTSNLFGDYPIIQMWSYDISEWEDYPPVGESDSFATTTQPVFDATDHVQDGVVQMRIYKASNGNINNHYYVDWVAIAKGYGTPSGQEIDPYSYHRDENIDAENYNATFNTLNVTGNINSQGNIDIFF